MEKRTEKLSRILNELNIDGLFITDLYNLRYFTGFTGTTGVALATKMEIFSFQISDIKHKLLNKLLKWDLNLWKFLVVRFRQLGNI